MGAPNHITTPVQNILKAAIPDPGDCAKLKAEFGVHTNTHNKNTRGKDKRTSAVKDLQSHHILQDAQTASIISRGRAIAVILQDGHSGSEHGDITARQNERMRNKGGAGGPAATMGALKKEAAEDLVAGLKGKRKGKTTKKPMTDKQAKALAKCLVKEADDAAKAEAKRNGDDAPTNSTPVDPPAGCLTAGTPVRLADGDTRPVEALRPGDRIWTPVGPDSLVRIDPCRHGLVELDVAGAATLVIATFHRLLTASGDWKRADEFIVGERVVTVSGPRLIEGVRRPVEWQTTYRLGFRRATICAVGAAGVWASMPETGPVVVPVVVPSEPSRTVVEASP